MSRTITRHSDNVRGYTQLFPPTPVELLCYFLTGVCEVESHGGPGAPYIRCVDKMKRLGGELFIERSVLLKATPVSVITVNLKAEE